MQRTNFVTHYANHSRKSCLEFINSFKEMLLPYETLRKDEKEDGEEKEEAEEEEEEKPSSNLHIIWDDTEMDDIDDDVMEEACARNDYNLQSKGVLKSNDSPSTSKTDVKKNLVATTYTKIFLEKDKDNGKDPTSIKSTKSMDLTHNILGDLKLDYDVVEDLKKMKSNITVFDLCKITQLREQLCKALQHIQGPQDVMVGNIEAELKEKNVKANKSTKASSVANASNVDKKAKTTVDQKKGYPRVDGVLIGNKSRSRTPPFLLTFEIFNQNVHGYLVDSGASSNVMPYLVCKNINVEPRICKTKIRELDKSNVNVMGELKDFLIQLASNSNAHQMIDIIVVDIPEAYRLILSID